jgi:hypothetical protein
MRDGQFRENKGVQFTVTGIGEVSEARPPKSQMGLASKNVLIRGLF